MDLRNRRKLRKAYDFIVKAMEQGHVDASGRLPSNIVLARMAGVSRFTIWQAVNALKAEGRLVGARKHRISLPGPRARVSGEPAHVSPPEPVRRTRTGEVQGRIRRDILNGRYRYGGPLPAEKELTAAYGVSRNTIRNALSGLIEENVLRRRGTRLLPVSISAPANRDKQRIVLLGYGYNFGHTITYGYWHQESLKLLEMECAKSNIGLDVVCHSRYRGEPYFFDGQPVAMSVPIPFTQNPDVFGYIVEVTGPESCDDGLLQMLAGWGKPVAILDEIGTWPSPAFLQRHPNVRVFRNTVSDVPAQQVARFVLELGHRTAVFISPHHQYEYSIRRYQGLLRAFGAADDAQLIAVTSTQGENYVGQGIDRTRLSRLTDFYGDWKKTIPRAYTDLLDNHMSQLRSLCAGGRLYEDLDELLDRALEIDKATAWIMVNDSCAQRAISYLREKGVAVPAKISVISFDDLPEALTLGITSYNFNHPAMMPAMLRYVTDPRLFPTRKPVIEIEGEIIPRRTTGKVREDGVLKYHYAQVRTELPISA